MTLRMTHNSAEVNQVPIYNSLNYFVLPLLHYTHIVAHKIYGVPQTINSANYVYFLAYQELFALRQSSSSTSHASVGGSTNSQRLYSDTELDKIVTGPYRSLLRSSVHCHAWSPLSYLIVSS